MGMQNSGWQGAGARLEDLSNISTFSGGAGIWRASLLATASPSAAQAQLGAMNQTISGPSGPILSDGGAITVTEPGASRALPAATALTPSISP